MVKIYWEHILNVRKKSPLVHNVTNYVVMNNTANALLAVGASPVMAHAQAEVRDMAALADALVINIGTLDEYWADAMIQLAATAQALGKPWVVDPVGAGATRFRDETLRKLLPFNPTVIRGNASEIMALAKVNPSVTKGVDSTVSSLDAVEAARFLTREFQSVVCISGHIDLIVDNQQRVIQLHNGHELMARVTGLGCTASALIAACLGVTENATEATAAAMALLGIAGELAEKHSSGPGSLQMHLLDKLYGITEEEFVEHLSFSVR